MRVAEGEQVENSWWRTTPLLLAATLAHVGVAIGVQIMPPLAPFYQEELGLSRAQVGTIVGAIYCGSMLASFPAGRAVDVVGVRRMLALSVVLMGVPVGLFALSTSLWPVLAAAVVGGLGYGAATPVSTRAVMDWFHGRIRGTAMGVKQTGMPLGGALVSATAPALAVAFGWRVALGFFSLFIMVLAALCFVWYRDAEQPAAVASTLSRSTRAVDGRMWQLGAVALLFALVQTSTLTFFALYLHETVQLSAVTAGWCLGLAQVSASFWRVGWGGISDRALGGRRRIVLLGLGLASTAVMFGVSLATATTPVWTIAALAVVFGATGLGWNGVFLTLVSETSGRQTSGTAVGFVMTFAFAGNLFGPPAFGGLVDWLDSYRLAWQILGGLALAGVGLLAVARLGAGGGQDP